MSDIQTDGCNTSQKREPLFTCENWCGMAYPADEMRIHDGDLICYECWEEYRNINSDGEYHDLPQFTPKAEREIEELAAQVERLRNYIERGSPWNTNPEKCERRSVLSETPPAALTALKAQWQALGAPKAVIAIEQNRINNVMKREQEKGQ